jgi:hypothetical protein
MGTLRVLAGSALRMRGDTTLVDTRSRPRAIPIRSTLGMRWRDS